MLTASARPSYRKASAGARAPAAPPTTPPAAAPARFWTLDFASVSFAAGDGACTTAGGGAAGSAMTGAAGGGRAGDGAAAAAESGFDCATSLARVEIASRAAAACRVSFNSSTRASDLASLRAGVAGATFDGAAARSRASISIVAAGGAGAPAVVPGVGSERAAWNATCFASRVSSCGSNKNTASPTAAVNPAGTNHRIGVIRHPLRAGAAAGSDRARVTQERLTPAAVCHVRLGCDAFVRPQTVLHPRRRGFGVQAGSRRRVRPGRPLQRAAAARRAYDRGPAQFSRRHQTLSCRTIRAGILALGSHAQHLTQLERTGIVCRVSKQAATPASSRPPARSRRSTCVPISRLIFASCRDTVASCSPRSRPISASVSFWP